MMLWFYFIKCSEMKYQRKFFKFIYHGNKFSNKNNLSAVCNWKFNKHQQKKQQLKNTMQT